MLNRFNSLISKDYKVFLLLFIIALICYTNVINGPMFFDDEHFIERNATIRSLKNIPEIYTTSVTEGAHISGNFYRPNQQLLYSVLFSLFELDPLPYHILPVLLHLLNAFLIFILLNNLGFGRASGFIAAVFFLSHPIQTESVSYISGLAGPLGLFFVLAALNQFVTGLYKKLQRQKSFYLLFSGLLFIVALLSKENMIVFLPLSILLFVFIDKEKKKNSGRYIISGIAAYFVISFAYLLMRFEFLNISDTIGLTDKDNIYTRSLMVRLITFTNVLWDYVVMIFYPLRLNYEKPYMAYVSLASFRGVFGIVFILAAIVSFVFRKKNKRVFLGLCWFFISLLPFTGIIPLNSMYLEHWLYVPIIGISILLASLFEFLLKKKKAQIFLYLFVLLITLYSIRTIARNNEWSDVEKFYLNELKYTDSSIRIYNNLGMYYADRNEVGKSIEYYKKAISAGDLFAQPHHNLSKYISG
jgi:hypothetical protein